MSTPQASVQFYKSKIFYENIITAINLLLTLNACHDTRLLPLMLQVKCWITTSCPYQESDFKGSVYTGCPGMVPEYGSCWALMWTNPFFQVPMLVFRHGVGAWVEYSGTKVGTGSLCVHCFCSFWGSPLLCTLFWAHVSKWHLTGWNGVPLTVHSHMWTCRLVTVLWFMAGSGDQIEMAIILWNSLPYTVNVADKWSSFKEDLREFLFNDHFVS